MTFLSGFTTNVPITEQIERIVQLAQFRSAKLMAEVHTGVDIERLRKVGVSDFVVRLKDSAWYNRDPEGRPVRDPDGTPSVHYPDALQWAAERVDEMQPFYDAGVRVFQIDNEPQMAWFKRGYGPMNYRFFMLLAMHEMRELAYPDVQFISPPLSFSPGLWRRTPVAPLRDEGDTSYLTWYFTLDDWKDAYAFTTGGGDKRTSLLRQFDYVGCNCYYPSEGKLYDPSFGGSFEQMQLLAGRGGTLGGSTQGDGEGMAVVLTEWGCSAGDQHKEMPMPEVDELMKRTYPWYLDYMRESAFVSRGHVFLVEGTPDWTRFRVSMQTAESMGRWTRLPHSWSAFSRRAM